MATMCIQQTILMLLIPPKPNKITAHLLETLIYLHRLASVHSECEALCAWNTGGVY